MAHRPLTYAFATSLALFLASHGAVANADTGPTGITVIGSAQVTAKPDMAEVRLGVVTQAKHAAAALNKNNRAMERLRALLLRRSLPKGDIQTTQFRIVPRYQRDAGTPARLTGYRAEHQINVKVEHLKALGTLLDAVVHAGANEISSVQFSVAAPRSLSDRARRRAIADARHRAAVYAEAAGVRLGRVTGIVEQGTTGPRPLALAAASVRAVPVAPGEITVRATVQVHFAIRRR